MRSRNIKTSSVVSLPSSDFREKSSLFRLPSVLYSVCPKLSVQETGSRNKYNSRVLEVCVPLKFIDFAFASAKLGPGWGTPPPACPLAI
jgi:hypothetical protein